MIFRKEFKSTFGKLISWALVLLILTGLILALYPLMLDMNMKSVFDSFLETLNPSFKSGLGLEEKLDYTKVAEFVAFAYQYIAVLIAMFAMQIGANALAREQSLGNIEYLYSNPISRGDIFVKKYNACILTYIIFLVLMLAGTFGLVLLLVPEEVDIVRTQLLLNLLKIFSGLLLTGLVYLSLGFFLSAISKTTLYTEGLSVLFVFINVLTIIAGKISGGTYKKIIDFFALETFKPIRILNNPIDFGTVGVNILVIVAFLLLTYIVYSKKELKY